MIHESPVIDAALVRRLIATQFPQWSVLPITAVEPGGWDNRTFRLGEGMTVRLPSSTHYVEQVKKEQHWLPILAPQLPLPIPLPLAMGQPDETYPWPWSVYTWLPGEPASRERIADLDDFALALAGFLNAMQNAGAAGGPPPGPHNFFRGAPLAVYDGETRQALAALDGRIDTEAATQVWDAALSTSWQQGPVWFHGDIAYGNLLVENGRLCAVIDFGTSGVGDPACDLAIAWHLFEGKSREVFHATRPLDEATWARGRGWTLWKAMIVAAGMSGAAPRDVEASWRVIERIVEDHRAWTR